MASDGVLVPILGSFIIVGWIILILEVTVVREYINRRNRRAIGIGKALVVTHGTKSFDQIEREFTENHAAGLSLDATLDLIASAYEDDDIKYLESTNSFAGSYTPHSDIRNAETLTKYIGAQGDPDSSAAQREEFKNKQTDALAISIVLNLIRQGSLKSEARS